jgi:hypothetical protein
MDANYYASVLLMVYNTVVFGVLLFGSDTMKNDMTAWNGQHTIPFGFKIKRGTKTSLRIQLFRMFLTCRHCLRYHAERDSSSTNVTMLRI